MASTRSLSSERPLSEHAIHEAVSAAEKRRLSEHTIREAVLAAGKKAAVKGLLWPKPDRPLINGFESICDIEAAKQSSRCKLCNFLKAVTPGNGKYVNDGPARLARSTVGAFFRFEPFRYHKVPLFYVAPGEFAKRGPWVDHRQIDAPGTRRISTVLGFSNADPYRDGVAIRHLSSYADLSLIRNWVQMCDELHADCTPRGGIGLQGFLLIDCKDGRNIVVDGDTSMQYVTLSYVWGSEESDGPDGSGKLPLYLPDLIKGVIKVVLALGYRYLWIDRYCVPQSDSSGIKSLLLQNMDKIYSQSALTIIAATTKCPSEGLAGITRPRVIEQKSLRMRSSRLKLPRMRSIHLLQWIHDVHGEVEGSVWNTRGWTYQEAVLSRRRLVFTEKQCYFQCGIGGEYWSKGGARMESIDYDLMTERPCGPESLIPSIFRPRRIQDPSGSDVAGFHKKVNDFIKRRLSSASDVLPAFLGILGMLTAESSDFHGHIDGVPVFEPNHDHLKTDTVGTLINGIAWYFNIDHERFDLQTAIMPSRRRVLPSWTWCDWVDESPSLYETEWEYRILSTEHPRRDMVLDTALSLEFEDGTVLPWPRDFEASDLAKGAMSIGNVRYLRITGWFTNLAIPTSDLNPGGHSWDWFYDYIPCRPYSIFGSTLFWLQRLAKNLGMSATENKQYVFKAWVFAPMVPSDYDARELWDDAWMMIMGETSTSDIFERIEVCKVIMKSHDMEDWKEKDVEDVAEIFGWELKAFKLA